MVLTKDAVDLLGPVVKGLIAARVVAYSVHVGYGSEPIYLAKA